MCTGAAVELSTLSSTQCEPENGSLPSTVAPASLAGPYPLSSILSDDSSLVSVACPKNSQTQKSELCVPHSKPSQAFKMQHCNPASRPLQVLLCSIALSATAGPSLMLLRASNTDHLLQLPIALLQEANLHFHAKVHLGCRNFPFHHAESRKTFTEEASACASFDRTPRTPCFSRVPAVSLNSGVISFLCSRACTIWLPGTCTLTCIRDGYRRLCSSSAQRARLVLRETDVWAISAAEERTRHTMQCAPPPPLWGRSR